MPAGYAQGTYKRWSNAETGDTDHITIDYRSAGKNRPSCFEGCLEGKKGIALRVLLCLTLFFIGLTIGYVIKKGQVAAPKRNVIDQAGINELMRESAKTKVNATYIKNVLRDFTRKIHLAGTARTDAIAEVIKDKWKAFGLDNVHQRHYKVLLSYHDTSGARPNIVSLHNNQNQTVQSFTNSDGSDDKVNMHIAEEALMAFNAYSPNGTVKGEPLFVNYGRKEDLDYLQNWFNISCAGKILIMKHGGIYLGNKIKLAEERGALGVITYPDPHDYALVRNKDGAYPKTWWLPEDNRQWGTIGKLEFGDPLTPEMPAVHGTLHTKDDPLSIDHQEGDMYSIKLKDADLPKIPVQGVSWGAARSLMLHMTASHDPDNKNFTKPGAWRGDLPPGEGLYNYGPGYQGSRKGWEIKLEVNNELQLKKIINVVGVIKGSVEPDRYVIIGSHHDAWTYGAIDPGSGLSILVELSRVFGEMVQTQEWRPRRTIMFVSFDAEKFGRIGSREWVEEYEKELSERAVAFISLDVGVTGNGTFNAESDLMLKQLIYDTAKKMKSPFNPNETLYDSWNRTASGIIRGRPSIPRMGAGGDYTNFIHRLGIPSLDMTFTSLFSNIHWDRSIYPSYNSAIDTFKYMEKFIDPDFEFHAHLTKMYIDIIMQLSDNERLPLNEDDTIEALNEGLSIVRKNKTFLGKLNGRIHYDVKKLEEISGMFRKDFRLLKDLTNNNTLRNYNDRIMKVSRAFVCPHGLTNRTYIKNLLVGPSSENSYVSEVFPGVQDAIRQGNSDTLVKEVWRLVLAIWTAAGALTDGFASDNPFFT